MNATALLCHHILSMFSEMQAEDSVLTYLSLANFPQSRDESSVDAIKAGQSGLAAYVRQLFDASLDWSTLRWLVEFTTLPVR